MPTKTFRFIDDDIGTEVRFLLRRETNWGGLPVATLTIEGGCFLDRGDRPSGSETHGWLRRVEAETGLRLKFRAVGWTRDRERWTRPVLIDPRCAEATEALLGGAPSRC